MPMKATYSSEDADENIVAETSDLHRVYVKLVGP